MQVEVINELVTESVPRLIIFSFFCSCCCGDGADASRVGCNAVLVTAGIIGSIIEVWPRLVIILGCCEEDEEKIH